ncbi:MAG: tail fiber domain-containing protein [Verrucomicrobiota bacterium]|nr:tail fiber domain-containing protein [Verrucomicrobiota bacterium]
MKSTSRCLLRVGAATIALIMALAAPSAFSADLKPPGAMAFQGFLTDGNGAPRGASSAVNLNVTFRIYNSPNAPSTDAIWAESQVVTVDKGHFSVVLGEGTAVPGLPNSSDLASLFNGDNSTGRYIGITVGNESEIAPRIQFLSAPYSHVARYATELIGTSSGANLTSLNASQLTSGSIPDLRLSSNVARRDVGNDFNGQQNFHNGSLVFDNAITLFAKNPAGGVEPFLYPRWSDNSTYMNYGLNGFYIRNRDGGTTMYMNNAGHVGIGVGNSPGARLHVSEPIGTSRNVNSGSIILDHENIGGASSILFRSRVNRGSDHAWIQYQDAATLGGGGEASVLSIGNDNDGDDHIALMPAGNLGVKVMSPRLTVDVPFNGTFGSSHSTGQHLASNRGNKVHFAHFAEEFAGMYVQVTDGKNGCGNAADIVFNTWECNTSNSREVFRINGGGRVGINNAFPQARLHVSSFVHQNRNFAFYARNSTFGTPQTGSSGGVVDYGIIADHRIGASEFNAFSDARIKTILGRSDTAKDLNTLLGIEVTDYRHKDVVQQGDAIHKKVIAQQVEKVFPQAVSQHTGLVPDIYKRASITNGWIYLKSDLKVGDKIRLVSLEDEEAEAKTTPATESESRTVFEVLELGEDKFRTEFTSKINDVFVYGREVKDFRSVDYNALAMLNISATQQLKKEKDTEVKSLQVENDALKTRIENLEARDKERLAAIEQSTTKMEAMRNELDDLKKLVAELGANRPAVKKVAAASGIADQVAR